MMVVTKSNGPLEGSSCCTLAGCAEVDSCHAAQESYGAVAGSSDQTTVGRHSRNLLDAIPGVKDQFNSMDVMVKTNCTNVQNQRLMQLVAKSDVVFCHWSNWS